jgi:signal transduction histidine kinase
MLRLPGADVESATWPADAPGEGVDYEVPVGIGPETFGSILVSVAPGRSLRSGEQRLLGDLADQAALAFRNSAMDAELTQHLADLDRRTQALAESRRRIVEARDRERSRLEASISHEVVAHLVGLPSALEHVHNGQGGDLPGQVEHWLAETTEALESLRGLTRAVFPTQLARAGLAAAMTSYLAQNGITGRLTIEDSMRDRRFDFRAETAAYFCFVEAMGDVDGHTRGAITLEGRDLVLRMRDPATPTMDLQAMTDRVEAVDGSLSIGTDGAGMTLTVRLPAEPAAVTGA